VRQSGWQLWGWPAGLAVLSIVGLVAALVDDGFWDALSWIALGIPAVLCVWGCVRALQRR
jgi:hypothetical protein